MTTNLIDVFAHSLPAYVWGGCRGFPVISLSPNFVEWGCGRTGCGWIGEGFKSPPFASEVLSSGPTKEWGWNLEAVTTLLLCYIYTISPCILFSLVFFPLFHCPRKTKLCASFVCDWVAWVLIWPYHLGYCTCVFVMFSTNR